MLQTIRVRQFMSIKLHCLLMTRKFRNFDYDERLLLFSSSYLSPSSLRAAQLAAGVICHAIDIVYSFFFCFFLKKKITSDCDVGWSEQRVVQQRFVPYVRLVIMSVVRVTRAVLFFAYWSLYCLIIVFLKTGVTPNVVSQGYCLLNRYIVSTWSQRKTRKSQTHLCRYIYIALRSERSMRCCDTASSVLRLSTLTFITAMAPRTYSPPIRPSFSLPFTCKSNASLFLSLIFRIVIILKSSSFHVIRNVWEILTFDWHIYIHTGTGPPTNNMPPPLDIAALHAAHPHPPPNLSSSSSSSIAAVTASRPTNVLNVALRLGVSGFVFFPVLIEYIFH